MTEPVPEDEQGGDPPCWAAQFADAEEGDRPVDEPADDVADPP